ncbi:MAG: type II toxin-antitoxin system Phd/YefM family antitoxin [Oscillospiraceae bacterium]|nr:type II toxin-antitoxin system Phd/YefM family antitoxin [Oscillospiraceae bacterium]
MKSLPSRELRNSYQKISEYCHKTHKPICVTLNGCDDLIAMDSESYEHMMDLLALAQQLTSAKEEREEGRMGFSPDELGKLLEKTLREV